jgi:hypothetical protein
MKAKSFFMAATIAALGLTACTNDDDVVTNDPNVVRFNASVDGNIMTRASINPGTGSGSFENGDVWGIFGKIASPFSWPLINEHYTVGSTTLYWDDISMTAPVSFTAYYPATAVMDDAPIYKFNAATAANPDLLIAGPVTASKGETVNLNFRHAMHQLAFNLDKDASIPGDILDAQFTLLNMKSTASVSMSDATVDVVYAEGNDVYPTKGTGEFFYVAPQDLIVGANWIEIELAGKTYIVKVPANLNPNNSTYPTRLESGKKLIVDVTMKMNPNTGKTGVSISTSTADQISSWGDQGQVGGVDANEI